MKPNSLSIVIPAHNERHCLPALLNSLGPLLQAADVEVVVVDNGSTDGTGELLATYPCSYVHSPHKVNPASARNMGVRASTGAVLAFLDADVVVMPRWIAELQRSLPQLVAQPMTITGDQCHISATPSWIEKYWFAPLRNQPKHYLNGANIVTTRHLFDRIRGFDQGLSTGEDVDFCDRAIADGGRVIFNKEFIVLHEDFPKSAARFIRRERWHGTGDFEQWGKFVRSKIALMATLFSFLHLALLGGIALALTGRPSVILISSTLAGIAALCLLSSVYRFRGAGLTQMIAGSAISYLYFVGRSLSLLQVAKRKLLGPAA